MTEKVRENKSAYHGQMKIWECDKRFLCWGRIAILVNRKECCKQDPLSAGGHKKTGGHTSSGFSFMVN